MSTMREEFEADYFGSMPAQKARARSGDGYLYGQAQFAWVIWQAAYAAGQRAATEQDAKVAEDWYFGDPGEVNHSIAVAIRARDKEHG